MALMVLYCEVALVKDNCNIVQREKHKRTKINNLTFTTSCRSISHLGYSQFRINFTFLLIQVIEQINIINISYIKFKTNFDTYNYVKALLNYIIKLRFILLYGFFQIKFVFYLVLIFYIQKLDCISISSLTHVENRILLLKKI